MRAADAVFGNSRQALMRGIVHDHQNLINRPPATRSKDKDKGKVHRPQLVRCARAYQQLTLGHTNLLATLTLDLQPLQTIQPLHPRVVYTLAGLAQLQVDHPRPISAVPLSQRYDPLAQMRVTIRPRLVPH